MVSLRYGTRVSFRRNHNFSKKGSKFRLGISVVMNYSRYYTLAFTLLILYIGICCQ